MTIDLDSYFARIGFTGTPRADRDTLRALHLGHATHIPFENLDIQMGLPIRLEPDVLHGKLVTRRRGGYCFEHNTLFLAVLREIGFDAEPYEARVRLGGTNVRPRTHMLLGVHIDGQAHVADVGFGGHGLLEPLVLDDGRQEQYDEAYRFATEGRERVLQHAEAGGWMDFYAFAPEPRPAVDFEVANHFTSTYPASPFVQTLTAQLPTPEARHVLRGRTYTVTRGGPTGPKEERLVDDAELLPLLRGRFGIDLPPGTRFRPPVG